MGAEEFVLDTPAIRAFIGGVREAIAARARPRPPATRSGRASPSCSPTRAWLPDELAEAVPDSGMGGGIGQWLLYRAGDESLSLFSLVVPSGSATPVHDHLAWGLVGLYRGEQDEEIYAREGEELRLVERRALHAGDFYALFPPHDDIHRVTHHLGGDVGLHPPADERHGLHLEARLRPGDRVAGAVPLGLRQRRVRRPKTTLLTLVDAARPGLYTRVPLSGGLSIPRSSAPIVGADSRSRLLPRFEEGKGDY